MQYKSLKLSSGLERALQKSVLPWNYELDDDSLENKKQYAVLVMNPIVCI